MKQGFFVIYNFFNSICYALRGRFTKIHLFQIYCMLYVMNRKIKFDVSYEDGYYTAVASGKEYAIVTEGKTFEILKKNIQEAVSLHLQDDDDTSEKQSEHVSLVASFKIPFPA